MCPQKAKSLCKTCGKPLGSAISVTQWISGADCQCSKLPSAAQSDLKAGSTLAENLCWGCGHPFKSGREGSFTQWIFRNNLCQCKEPILHRPGIPRVDIKSRYSKQRNTFDTAGLESAFDDAENLFQQRYALLEEIDPDQDNFAFAARDIVLSKTVSIVRFNPVAEENAAQCQALAKTLSMLQHPAIVPLKDFGIDDRNRPFFVADFVNEQSLSELIEQENRLPVDTAFDITLQLCDCLEFAHGKDVHHGDLNSDNVFVTMDESEPRLQLVEFGYSAVQSLSAETQTNTASGLSDAQAGRNRDLLSVASLLFEMLNGSRPFQQVRAGQFRTTLKLDAPDLGNPDEWNTILSRVFAPNGQADKIESIAEFKEAVITTFNSEGISAKEGDTKTPTTEKPKTYKSPLLIGSIVLAVAVMIPIAISVAGWQSVPTGSSSQAESRVRSTKSGTAKKLSNNSLASIDEKYTLLDKAMISKDSETSFKKLTTSEAPILSCLDLTPEKARRIAANKEMQSLYMEQCDFTIKAIEALSAAQPRIFEVTHCLFDDQCLMAMLKNPKLEKLKLRYVPVTDKGLELIKHHKNIKFLSLGPLKTTDAAWSKIGEIESLKSLHIYDGNQFANSQLKLLAEKRPKRLEQLCLVDTAVTGEGYKYLQSMPALRRLFFAESKSAKARKIASKQNAGLTDQSIETLLRNKNIKEIYLSYPNISGAAFRKLLEAPHIENISFEDDTLPLNCLPAAAKTKHLKSLDVVISDEQIAPIMPTNLQERVPLSISSRSWMSVLAQFFGDSIAASSGQRDAPSR